MRRFTDSYRTDADVMGELRAFQITGIVEADTLDEACAAIAAYCDPASDDVPDFEETTPVRSVSFRWATAKTTSLEEANGLFSGVR